MTLKLYTDYPPGIRAGSPRIVRLAVRTDTPYLTFGINGPWRERFAIIGTDYGFLRNSFGGIRFWFSESGARAKLKAYRGHP